LCVFPPWPLMFPFPDVFIFVFIHILHWRTCEKCAVVFSVKADGTFSYLFRLLWKRGCVIVR
jgi:hypothetical protein